ncbi:TlpA family protein disulfide reductase [Dyella sp. 20L07]|uniref:TlpA family protein disulfide reductase n=1 Tax=Dyella sp. 20L07 TaxID=3384240 RepID=UPI003D2E1F00
MKRSIRYMLTALALVIASTSHAKPGEGDIPPDYLGHDRNGQDVRLSALRGKVVIVSFWASWCGYCMKELPVLAAVQKMKGPADLQVVGVSHEDDLDTFSKIRRRWKDLDIILTYDGGDQRIAKPYGVKGIPHMVMIGRDGRIAHIHIGYGEDMAQQILDEVDELLDQPAPPPATTLPATPTS